MTKFNAFDLSASLLDAIEKMGFTEASPIQVQAIPILLTGKDIIGQAQTGTGKTAAFAIPSIEKVDTNLDQVQILVLCPTRELVVQVAGEFEKLTINHKNLNIVPIYGGQNITIQLKELKRGAHIVIGTPGRIMDHQRRGTLNLDHLKVVVLDEADQMLDMGFHEDMEVILSQAPAKRQTIMFSATMTRPLMTLMEKFQKKPERISAAPTEKQSKQIRQFYFNINSASKTEALKRLLSFYKIKSALIFCNTKLKVDELLKVLSSSNFSAAGLHGDMEQKRRDRVMEDFKDGSVELLIATDVAARGIDVNDLEAVINYDLPRFDQDYIHRIGRTGRAGKDGLALSFVVGKELDHLKRIAQKNNLSIENSSVPEVQDIEKSTMQIIKKNILNSKIDETELKKYTKYLSQLKTEERSEEEIFAILLKTLMDKETKSINAKVDFRPEEYKAPQRNRSRNSFGNNRRPSNFKSNSPSSSKPRARKPY